MFLVTFTEKDITVLLMIYSCMLFLSLIFRQGNACKYPYVAIFMFLQVLAMILAIVIYGVAWAEPKVESHGFLYSVSSFVVGLQGGVLILHYFQLRKKRIPIFFRNSYRFWASVIFLSVLIPPLLSMTISRIHFIEAVVHALSQWFAWCCALWVLISVSRVPPNPKLSSSDVTAFRVLLLGYVVARLAWLVFPTAHVVECCFNFERLMFFSNIALYADVVWLTCITYYISRISMVWAEKISEKDTKINTRQGCQVLAVRLEQYMKRNKPYLHAGLNIDELACQLDVPVKKLSVTINDCLHKNFIEFINEYRVNDAAKLLLSEKTQSVLDVSFCVGFNSKSTFNAAFKKSFSATPTEYRKLANL